MLSTTPTFAPLAKTVLWPLFGIVSLVYVIVSLVLVYHWRKYALHNTKLTLVEIIYFIFSLSALAVAACSIIFI